jgi:hypothetical protein
VHSSKRRPSCRARENLYANTIAGNENANRKFPSFSRNTSSEQLFFQERFGFDVDLTNKDVF